MFLSGNGKNSVKTVRINDKIEKVNYTNWMIKSRCLSYKLINTGHGLYSYCLQVRNLRYNDKIYAFNIEPDDNYFIHVPFLADDGGLISAYQIAFYIKYYEEFIKKYLELSINKLGSGTNDDFKKLIIELFNDLVEYGEAFPTKDMYFNQWYFDPMNFNEEYSARNTKKVRNEFKPGELVKLIDNKKNKTYYGCLRHFDKEDSIALTYFKCFSLDFNEFDEEKEDEIICFKFFLPDFDDGVVYLLDKKKPRFEFKKAELSELNEEQKELYEIYSKNRFMR